LTATMGLQAGNWRGTEAPMTDGLQTGDTKAKGRLAATLGSLCCGGG
jgi:hypothetical protein